MPSAKLGRCFLRGLPTTASLGKLLPNTPPDAPGMGWPPVVFGGVSSPPKGPALGDLRDVLEAPALSGSAECARLSCATT